MKAKEIAAVRAYLRVWIFAPEFDDEDVEAATGGRWAYQPGGD